ncbi:SHOCT domain-containing protein [Georgenia satyanarayanai]|uniref:SHOCT domain-containing protein n=1 Tax=Georgenia satyanarayanai TaxID=860221 RepID=UPI00203BEB9E|nr:SHOCT domain-containing protein [Georgenia satyanarayanai]MCM3659835.1 SHOCT domain-containing protein [Georgenia satyanarayanai]
MATVGENPLLPATYDAVWSLVLVAVLVAVALVATAAMRALRQRTAGDTVARVQALAALHASGAISDEEYERRRERLLDQL